MKGESELKKLLASGLQFASSHPDEEVFHQEELIQLFPFGLSLQNDSERPFLLLKSKDESLTLPVAINPLEAGLTLNPDQGTGGSPHRFTRLLLESLEIQALQCVFVQIRGAHQYVRVYLQGHPRTNSIKLRADEAMSLCLHLGIPIFATRRFMDRSRLMAAEIEGVGKGLKSIPQIRRRPASPSWMN